MNIAPRVTLPPHIAAAAVVGYLTEGRMRLPKDAPVFEIDDAAPDAPVAAAPAPTPVPAETMPDRT